MSYGYDFTYYSDINTYYSLFIFYADRQNLPKLYRKEENLFGI